MLNKNQSQEETNLIQDYFSNLHLNPKLPKEFIQLIQEFYISTHPIYGDPYTWDYFDLQDITLINSSFDFSNAPQELKSYQGDPDFGASVLHFNAITNDEGLTIFDYHNPNCNYEILKHYLQREWETFFNDPELATELVFDFQPENKKLNIYLICY